MSISFIVPTVGRETLRRTLDSIKTWPGDEILLVYDKDVTVDLLIPYRDYIQSRPEIRHVHCPRGNDWGSSERNFSMPLAKGDHLAFIDDDDYYVSAHRELMEDAIKQNPDRPTVFRMRFPNGITLWYEGEQRVRCGNIGTPMFLMPNVPEKLGTWGPLVGGDCIFVETSGWPEVAWREEIIALIGHNV